MVNIFLTSAIERSLISSLLNLTMQIIDVILFELTVLDANREPKGFQPWKRLKILEEVNILFWIKT